MVEGIVFDVKRDFVIVMTKSGEFKKLKKKGTVKDGEIYRGKTYTNQMKYYAAAAIILFLVTSFTGYNAYAHQIVGYVDIKGKTAVRLYINRLGNVQKSEGLSNGESIKNLSIYDAVKHIALQSKNATMDLQNVKFKEIKHSKFTASEVEKKIKDTLGAKDASSPKDNKNGGDSTHASGKDTTPSDNKNTLDNRHGNNTENEGGSQFNTPSSNTTKKNNQQDTSNANSSTLNKSQDTGSRGVQKNIKRIKIGSGSGK